MKKLEKTYKAGGGNLDVEVRPEGELWQILKNGTKFKPPMTIDKVQELLNKI